MATVFVLDQQGNPLDQTTRCRHVRLLLKSGKATVVQAKPFTIQLTYEAQNPEATKQYTLGIDPGRTNIGLSVVDQDGRCVFQAEAVTRNKDVPKLMKARAENRRAHRTYGRRKVRQRRAFKQGTTTQKHCQEHRPITSKNTVGVLERFLPGYEKPVKCVGIKNKEAKFNNRKREDGWLTPTANHLLQTHLELVRKIQKFLPVSQVVLEVNKFAFMAMDNPNVQRWDYQRGPLYGKGSLEEAVYELQDGKCLLTGEPIAHYHHIVPRSKGGSNTIGNIAGLSEKGHSMVHTDAKAEAKLKSIKAGLNKKYGALSVLNQIIPYLAEELIKMLPIYTTTGKSSKEFRDEFHVPKTHANDAYSIACSVLNLDTAHIPEGTVYLIRQFRRQDRQACQQKMADRKYYLDGALVATNRHKRMEQKTDSLKEFRLSYKEADVSKLAVKEHKPQYKNQERHLPGSVFLFEGSSKRHVLDHSTGFHNGRPDYYFDTEGNKFLARKCNFIQSNAGLMFA